MIAPWSPSTAREALRAELCWQRSENKMFASEVYVSDLQEAVLPESTVCDTAEGFAEWLGRWTYERAPDTEQCREVLAQARAISGVGS